MSTSTLPVSTIVTVQISQPQPGLLVPNVNNICILDTETPSVVGNLIGGVLGIYQTAAQVGVDWGTSSEAYNQAVMIFNQKPNMLAGGGQLVIYYMTGSVTTLSEAIAAVEGLLYVGGYLYAGYSPLAAEVVAAATAANAIGSGKPIGCSSYQTTDLNTGGLFQLLSAADLPAAVPLLYTQAGTAVGARLAMAACFAAQMSTDFSGQNTALNLNLKTLQGVPPDVGITPAVLATCATLGVGVYASIQGVAKFVANGGPNFIFFDNVYNLNWFSNALQIAYFDTLAQTATKIPQTEAGMTMIKNSLIAVCQQAVINGYLAPGTWNSTDTFGNQDSFLRNIAQLGYYVYTAPIGTQSEATRMSRVAPTVQLAAKLAGAINRGAVIGFINP
jgi:hypothetical protein